MLPEKPEKPYIAGNSVSDSQAFVGRADVLRKVLNVLRDPHQNAIVLFGQRRIGKTSVLRELEAKLPTDGYRPIFFDLQDKTQWPLERVLHTLAKEISYVLQPKDCQAPDLGADPETTFREVWLPKVLDTLPTETSLVLLFDEFDVLADPKDEQASTTFFPYLRHLLTIDLQRLNFVFVIGRKIDELNTLALSAFKGIDTHRVSLLNEEDTIQLIRLSEINQTLDWTNEAIDKIWQQTNGHPLLTQSLCAFVWDNIYVQDQDQLPTATMEDVEMALPKVLEKSLGALEWLWDGLGSAERVVISALASAGAKPISENELEDLLRESGVRVVIRELQNAPGLLQKWDLIEPVDGGYRFRVELLRRWVADYKPLSRVQEELDRIQSLADNLYQAGVGFYQVGKLDEAISILWQAINSNPNHGGASQLLAEILLAQNKVTEACDVLENLYEYQPSVARPRLVQALLALAQNSNNESEQLQFYERVLEFESEHPEAKNGLQTIWQQRGDHAYEKGNLDKALDAYRKAENNDKVTEIEENIRTQSYLPEWYLQAQSALQQGDKQKAQTFFAKIIAVDPEYKEVSRYLHVAVTNVDPKIIIDNSEKCEKKFNIVRYLFAASLLLLITVIVISFVSNAEKEQLTEELNQTKENNLRAQIDNEQKDVKIAQLTKELESVKECKLVDSSKNKLMAKLKDKLEKTNKEISQAATLNDKEKLQLKSREILLKNRIKHIQAHCMPPLLWELTEPYKFMLQLEHGDYMVIVETIKNKKQAQAQVEKIKLKHPEFYPYYFEKENEGIFFDGENWAIYVGGFYSQTASENLITRLNEDKKFNFRTDSYLIKPIILE